MSIIILSLLINAVILLLNCLVLILYLYIHFLSLRCYFLFVADTVLKVSRSLYCFTTSISHAVENYFPRLWGTGISDAIFYFYLLGVANVGVMATSSLLIYEVWCSHSMCTYFGMTEV